MLIKGPKEQMGAILVRLNGLHPMNQDIAAATKIFKHYNPMYPFDYTFTDEDYATKFLLEKFIGKLTSLFAGLVIFISCLGLFGLATYMAQARVKEIGVRKVLGASANNITILLSRDLVKLVALAIVIATPVAWFTMHNWLSTYDYRVPVGWGTFALSGAVALFIAIGTVSYHSIRAALVNPVKSLRTE
jgi:ABC-type antimicrobial peptide transport system permease subunit